jgi:hypothetical protein
VLRSSSVSFTIEEDDGHCVGPIRVLGLNTPQANQKWLPWAQVASGFP